MSQRESLHLLPHQLDNPIQLLIITNKLLVENVPSSGEFAEETFITLPPFLLDSLDLQTHRLGVGHTEPCLTLSGGDISIHTILNLFLTEVGAIH